MKQFNNTKQTRRCHAKETKITEQAFPQFDSKSIAFSAATAAAAAPSEIRALRTEFSDGVSYY